MGWLRGGFWASAVLAAVLFCAGCAGAEDSHAPLQPLTIESGTGSHGFRIELAADDDARGQGLMFRRHIDPDYGMLFDFGRDEPVAMWMRNTYIPLDMLFIDRQGRITHIQANARPLDDTIIESHGPVRAVLEIEGGAAARLGIKVGDRVAHPLFDHQP